MANERSRDEIPAGALASRLGCTLLFSAALPLLAQARSLHTTNNGAITITGYTGTGGAVEIPGVINGLPVTRIGPSAFR